ncbi:MAG: hypothetical protein EPN97_15455 [Alphaproteobacteria bacterium]|nr:MAG: hypothetical protein EPN97_15455 [Alphaproteobacteria bacterium]
MINEQQKGESFEKRKVPPAMPEDKKDLKKDLKQQKPEADEEAGDASIDKGEAGAPPSEDEE